MIATDFNNREGQTESTKGIKCYPVQWFYRGPFYMVTTISVALSYKLSLDRYRRNVLKNWERILALFIA